MTGLNKIVNTIEEQASAEAEALLSKAREQAQTILYTSNEKASAAAETIVARAMAEAKTIEGQVVSSFQLHKRQELLLSKQKAIVKTLKKAREHIGNLGDEEYLRFFEYFSQKTVISPSAVVSVNTKDRGRLGEKIIDRFGGDVSAALSPTPAQILGGFILTDEQVIINCSVEALFENNHEKLSDLVAETLFK